MALKMKIAIVGCGGTGSAFIEKFTRYLAAFRKHNLPIEKLLIIDGDSVETKNLKNQAFMPEDVGYKKSAVLADCMNGFLNDAGSDFIYQSYGEYLVNHQELMDIIGATGEKDELVIIIGACDNHACRLLMEDVFFDEKLPNVFLYDSANEFKTGEVVFAHKIKSRVLSEPRSKLFPDVLSGDLRNVTEMSCEELNNVAPQHILINQLAALQLMMGLTSFLEDGKMMSGVSYFNASMSTQFFPSQK